MSFLLSGYYQGSTGECDVVTPNIAAELDMYISDKSIATTYGPLKWWNKNAGAYPHVAELARKLLSIPSTEVPSERVFSTAGGTVTKLRSQLNSDNIDKLIFLHKFYSQTARCAKLSAADNATVPTDISTPVIKQEPCDVAPITPENQRDLPEQPSLPSLAGVVDPDMDI